jgi:hypothetical protein
MQPESRSYGVIPRIGAIHETAMPQAHSLFLHSEAQSEKCIIEIEIGNFPLVHRVDSFAGNLRAIGSHEPDNWSAINEESRTIDGG